MTAPTASPLQLLRIEDVAEETGIPIDTLRYWRRQGTGPKAARIGRRVVYRARDVQDWIDAQFDAS